MKKRNKTIGRHKSQMTRVPNDFVNQIKILRKQKQETTTKKVSNLEIMSEINITLPDIEVIIK